MFTINIYLKFALIAVGIIGGIIMAFILGFWYAFPFILAGVLLLVSYVLLGTVQSSAKLMEQMDFEAVEKRLALTLNPKWLYVTNRAFYYIIKGTMALNLKRNDEAEELFHKAKDLKLPSDNEKAMVLLQLANINANKNKWNKAKVYYTELKKLKVDEPQMKEQIKQFDAAFKQRGQAKHLHSGGAMRQGGKRRRPKMR